MQQTRPQEHSGDETRLPKADRAGTPARSESNGPTLRCSMTGYEIRVAPGRKQTRETWNSGTRTPAPKFKGPIAGIAQLSLNLFIEYSDSTGIVAVGEFACREEFSERFAQLSVQHQRQLILNLVSCFFTWRAVDATPSLVVILVDGFMEVFK